MSFKIADLYAEFRVTGLSSVRAGLASMHGSLAAASNSLGRMSAGLRGVGAVASAAGTKLMIFGGIGTAAMVKAAHSFMNVGDELAKMSDKTGMSVETLSELSLVAELSDLSLQGLAHSIRFMQRFLSGAAGGGKGQAGALKGMGLSAKELMALAPEEQLKAFADAISKIENPAQRTAMAMQVFGRAGAGMLPMLKDGAAGITILQQKARDLGLVIDTETARSAERLQDELKIVWKTIKMTSFWVGAALAPALSDLARTMAEVMGTVIKWVRENSGLIVGFAKLSLAVVGLGLALKVVGWGFGALAVGLTILKGLVLVVAALATPIGLLSGLLAAAAAEFALVVASGGSMAGLREGWKGLAGDAIDAITGIGDALVSGDIGLAADILWASLKVAFGKGWKALTEGWHTAVYKWENLLTNVGFGLVNGWENICYTMQTVWTDMVAGLSSIWVKFTATFKDAMVETTSTASTLWNAFLNKIGVLSDEELAAKVVGTASDAHKEQKRINDEKTAGLAKIEKKRKDKQDETDDAHMGALLDNADAYDALMKQSANDYIGKIRAGEEELSSLKAKRDEQLYAAMIARKNKEGAWMPGENKVGTAAAGGSPAGGVWKGLGDVWKDMQAGLMKQDPLLKEAEETNDHLEAIEVALGNIGGGAVAV